MVVRSLFLFFTLTALSTSFTIYDKHSKSNRTLALDDFESECNCVNGRCVTDNRGRKKCDCLPRHSAIDEQTCQRCDCGSKGKCIFLLNRLSNGSVQHQKKCICDKGSAEKDGLCIDCHCGLNSKCEFEGEEKICYCEDGYSEKDGVCTECNCGEYGECKFEAGQKRCSCFPGFLETKGFCKECDCGENGVCSFSYGEKICKCDEGFSDNYGICEKCDCGSHSYRCRFIDGKKSCNCEEGYVQKYDTCEIGCGKHRRCENGGICKSGFCDCLEGTAGDFCDVVKECNDLCPKRTDVRCLYDVDLRKAVCQCKDETLRFDLETEQCKVACGELRPCRNGGVCSSGRCDCLKGTTGDFCEVVKECEYLCPDDPDVSCLYDVGRQKAVCKCHYDDYGFDQEMKRCRRMCEEDRGQCKNGGTCEYNGFCRCLRGTSGDLCELVHKCVVDKYFCDDGAVCYFDVTKESADCACPEGNERFDHKTRHCRVTCDSKDRLCENGGTCESGFCTCMEGTSGDLCQVVEKCIAEKVYCEDGATCYFDQEMKKANCRCPREAQEFDHKMRKCRDVCDRDRDCSNGGLCSTSGDFSFCHCMNGTRGDRCDRVDQCEVDKHFCEDGASCYFDVQMKRAMCRCPKQGYAYDSRVKKCKKTCAEDRTCRNGGRCYSRDEAKFCECLPGTSGDHCDSVDRCRSENNYCGTSKDVRCMYDISLKKAVCSCDDTELKFDRIHMTCRETCSDERTCRNGGTCWGDEAKFCKCLPGTSGDHCDSVDRCRPENNYCGTNKDVRCMYDESLKNAVCICDDSEMKFDRASMTCKKTCTDERTCNNGGLCYSYNGAEFCECLPRTSGDLCDSVDQCHPENNYCGTNKDVRCKYDESLKNAVCICDDSERKFDRASMTCKKTCSEERSCHNGGICSGYDIKFCKCMNGTSGDHCDSVDQCRLENNYCGTGTDVKCTYDISLQKAVCICADSKMKFDRTSMTCKKTCSEERSCHNGGTCSGYDIKFCKCLNGTSGDHCDSVDECRRVYNYCGTGTDVKCTYDISLKKAVCICADSEMKFDRSSMTCKKTCDSNSDCNNGGKCRHTQRDTSNFCECLPGVSGDHCEDIDECIAGNLRNCKGEKGACVYDFTHERAKCVCGSGKEFDEITNTCKNVKPCEPNPCIHGKCITKDRDFECLCTDPFIGRFCEISTCLSLECFGGKCQFSGGKEVCICPDGHELENGTCTKTTCTETSCFDGKCKIINGEEVCQCFEGYVLEGQYCRKLNCSNTPCINGTCIVRHGNTEECVCPAGFTLDKDTCKRGLCRVINCYGGNCKTVDGELVCVCPENYHHERNGCYATICRENRCYGGKCVVRDNKEICYCKEGYVLVKDVCKLVLCKEKNCFGGKCNLVNGKEECTCPPGFSIFDDVCREDRY